MSCLLLNLNILEIGTQDRQKNMVLSPLSQPVKSRANGDISVIGDCNEI